jgi:hypothetical protein
MTTILFTTDADETFITHDASIEKIKGKSLIDAFEKALNAAKDFYAGSGFEVTSLLNKTATSATLQ